MQTTNAQPLPVAGYEAPAVDCILTSAQLESDIVIAGYSSTPR